MRVSLSPYYLGAMSNNMQKHQNFNNYKTAHGTTRKTTHYFKNHERTFKNFLNKQLHQHKSVTQKCINFNSSGRSHSKKRNFLISRDFSLYRNKLCGLDEKRDKQRENRDNNFFLPSCKTNKRIS